MLNIFSPLFSCPPSPSLSLSLSLLGKGDLFLSPARVHRHDFHGTPELPRPPVATGDRAIISEARRVRGGGAPIPDLERRRASPDLRPTTGSGRGVAVSEQGQGEREDGPSGQRPCGALLRSVELSP